MIVDDYHLHSIFTSKTARFVFDFVLVNGQFRFLYRGICAKKNLLP